MRYALCLLALLAALPAFALDLQQARSEGVLGERRDGFVETLKATPESQRLAGEVNARRRMEYERISRTNGQPVDVVAALAAEQVIAGLPKGAMYQDAAGAWQTK